MNELGQDFQRVLEEIDGSVDFEPEYYNEAYLSRRISARMRRQNVDTHADYLAVLTNNSKERDALLDSLTINVTNFFRNRKMWRALQPVLRELSTSKRRVRIWSAPCADGREPYSLAMLALDDPQIDASRIEILGTDISEEALANARNGVYETTRTTDIEAELDLLDDPLTYVEKAETRFSVKPAVQSLVTFEKHDLIADPQKSGFDLALCRNLLIYIDSEFKLSVFEAVADSLVSDGYLVVGMTETVPSACRDTFEPVNKRCRIYKRVK
ncbi:CheR family methyltransferase [Halalkalirubrum salinum]|uniref:CheR family methyltransferase n=1 Tax=Halalkalirubrum salinum TaxID=2563889 RepID=UPI0010FAE4A3|nr:protein-glutamate O-methyltransferase CheR [Halalkalirubrum salinum]